MLRPKPAAICSTRCCNRFSSRASGNVKAANSCSIQPWLTQVSGAIACFAVASITTVQCPAVPSEKYLA
jgi:hypothetical protein